MTDTFRRNRARAWLLRLGLLYALGGVGVVVLLAADGLVARGQGITQAPATSMRAMNSHQTEDLSLEDYFQRFVLEHQDSMSETELAQKLGVSRKCLWERRQRFGIPRQKSTAGSRPKKPDNTDNSPRTNVTGS